MTWHCDCCGATFDEPLVKSVIENLDGENGWWQHLDIFCPVCGGEQIEGVISDVEM